MYIIDKFMRCSAFYLNVSGCSWVLLGALGCSWVVQPVLGEFCVVETITFIGSAHKVAEVYILDLFHTYILYIL